MPNIGNSGFLGRVNNAEDVFRKRKKNTVDNTVTPSDTSKANVAKIATPNIKTNTTSAAKGKSISTDSYVATDANVANNAMQEALRKSGIVKEKKEN